MLCVRAQPVYVTYARPQGQILVAGNLLGVLVYKPMVVEEDMLGKG